MRGAATRWLPKETRESQPAYDSRLKRSILYGALKDTLDNATAKPFAQPITLPDIPLHEKLEKIEGNADRNGQDLTSFGAEAFKAALAYGLTHAIVDYPAAKTDDEGNTTDRSVQDERDEDIRPYFVHVPPTALIGFRSETLPSGDKKILMARIKSEEEVPDGEYGEKTVYRITVWTDTDVSIHESDTGKEGSYKEQSRTSHTYGEVPLETLYIERTGHLTGAPPFEDLAWLNIAHWQSFSDQRNILRIARVPIIVAAGFTNDEIGENFSVSSSRFVRTKNPEASIKHVEHTGKAIAAGEEDLKRLEERMVMLGLQPFVQRSGSQTATGKAIDESRTHTAIQAWIRECEGFIHNLYKAAARWIDSELPEKFAVSINSDFGFALNGTDDIANLLKARLAGELSRATFLHELKRRGLLAEGVVIDDEVAAIEAEGPEPEDADIPALRDGDGDGNTNE